MGKTKEEALVLVNNKAIKERRAKYKKEFTEAKQKKRKINES